MSPDVGVHLGFHIYAKTFGLPDDPEPVSGVRLQHVDPEGKKCIVVLNFDTAHLRRVSPNTKKFTVLRLLPLTIKETIKCQRCGLIGYVSNGHWEFA